MHEHAGVEIWPLSSVLLCHDHIFEPGVHGECPGPWREHLLDAALHTRRIIHRVEPVLVERRLPRGAHPSIAPSQLVRTKDGWGLLMCQTPKFWTLWCQLTGTALGEDPRFSSIPARRENLPALSDAVDQVMMAKTTSEWVDVLGGAVPFAPVLDIGEALDNPYVAHVEMTAQIDHPDTVGGLRTLASPFRVNGERPTLSRAPKMGEHSDALLKQESSV